MNIKMYIIGGLIYVILAIVLGMVGGMIHTMVPVFALLISGLIAGFYVGRKAGSPTKGAIDGIIAGLIGGIIAAIIAAFVPMPTTSGVSLLDQVALFIGGMLGPYLPVAGATFFVGEGILLGAIGGFIGKKLKK